MITKVMKDEHGIIYEYDSGKRVYITISDTSSIHSLMENKETDKLAETIEKFDIKDICIVNDPISNSGWAITNGETKKHGAC